jgi:hypothetical protein
MQFGFNKLWFELNPLHCNFAANSLFRMGLRSEQVCGIVEGEVGVEKRGNCNLNPAAVKFYISLFIKIKE